MKTRLFKEPLLQKLITLIMRNEYYFLNNFDENGYGGYCRTLSNTDMELDRKNRWKSDSDVLLYYPIKFEYEYLH